MVKATRDVGLQEIQEAELEVFETLLTVLKKHKLKYFITGGTVLGARYYKGFIPYDDDIDIAMPRHDYQRLIKLGQVAFPQDMVFEHYSLNQNFKYSIIRIENKNVDIYEASDPSKKVSHPSIDIAALDGVPKGKMSRFIFFKRLLLLRGLLSWHYADSINMLHDRSILQKVVIKILHMTAPIGKNISPNNIKTKIDDILSKYPYNKSPMSGTYMGAYKDKEMINTAIWGDGKDYQFQHLEVNGPERIEEYIQVMYGSFRELDNAEALKMRHYILKEKE